jgi:hypothetical protein
LVVESPVSLETVTVSELTRQDASISDSVGPRVNVPGPKVVVVDRVGLLLSGGFR